MVSWAPRSWVSNGVAAAAIPLWISPFTSTHGHMHIFHRTPATRLAIRWPWEDLEALGFLKGTPPQYI